MKIKNVYKFIKFPRFAPGFVPPRGAAAPLGSPARRPLRHEVPLPPLEGEVPNEREAEGFVR